MRFARLQKENGQPFLAVVNNENATYARIDTFENLKALICNWDKWQLQAKNIQCTLPLKEVKILAPLRPERNIFCIGKNYAAHAAEVSQSGFDSSMQADDIIPEYPIVFTKTPETVIGTNEKIPAHKHVTSQLDYEAELAVIIGKEGKGINKEEALDYVWGYTIVNDVTARDVQKKHKQWTLGKSLDGFAPMGPVVVTKDEINLSDTKIKCWINKELRQDANISELIFDVPTLIECISAGITLKPGDVIITGTPQGVGAGFNPPKYLQTGDVITVEIEGIGILENEVGE